MHNNRKWILAAMPVLAALMMAIPAVATPASGEEGHTGDGEGFVVTSAELFAPIMAEDVLVAVGAVVLKFSSTGELLWEGDLGSGMSPVNATAVTPSGFIAVGNAYIAKYNDSGDRVWQKNIGRSGSVAYYAVTAAGEGFVAVGTRGEDAVIAMYDGDGSLMWERTLSGPGPGYRGSFSSVAAVPGGFVAAGSVNKDISDGRGWYIGTYSAIISKYSTSGDVLWATEHVGASSSYFNSVVPVSDGFVTVGAPGGKSAITKYDGDGVVAWENGSGNWNSTFLSVAALDDGFIVVGDARESAFGRGEWVHVYGKGQSDGVAVRLTATGDMLWAKNFGGAGQDAFQRVAAAPGGFVAVGYASTGSFGTGDLTGIESKTSLDTILVKFDDTGAAEWAHNLGGLDIEGFFADLLLRIGVIVLALAAVIAAVLLFLRRRSRGSVLSGSGAEAVKGAFDAVTHDPESGKE